MNWILTTEDIHEGNRQIVGGKGFALSQLAKAGFAVPNTLCVTSDAYHDYVNRSGLRERILLEVNRKDFKDMRWEEIWDCATRIRNMFLTVDLPPDLIQTIRDCVHTQFQDKPVAIRSSAPDEDTQQSSFAGLHESFINVRGADDILKYLRLVWASLWSDAALLYRQEIGLDVEKSAMAVVIQESIAGDRSGVVFTRNPNDESQAILESVYGLNQGLVDGTIEPDRWIIDRSSQKIVSHVEPQRNEWITPSPDGIRQTKLPPAKADQPPLDQHEVQTIYATARKAENHFGSPQDVEWTYQQESLVLLQSRPITTLRSEQPGDQRGWYLSLHRSFDNLKDLRQKIETELIPEMIAVAKDLSDMDLTAFSTQDLAREIKRRWDVNHKWVNIYWADFIPYAHGVRLFGQVYNDVVRPEDPYEFMDLLAHTGMASIQRNNMLMDLAELVRTDPLLRRQLQQGESANLTASFTALINEFIAKFGDLSCAVTGGTECTLGTGPLFNLILEMAAYPPQLVDHAKTDHTSQLRQKYLAGFEADQQEWAQALLDLARNSYQLRDDDNIYLGRIEAQLLAAVQEAKHRLETSNDTNARAILRQVLTDVDMLPEKEKPTTQTTVMAEKIKARQLTGQPAGPGIAKGKARVIHRHEDLANFKHGEVLICDAVDPNITFVVPLATAVVERRGGMLIHGAIIAREYGLPCITGVPDATNLIHTGDDITVDGYLGIVTLGETKI